MATQTDVLQIRLSTDGSGRVRAELDGVSRNLGSGAREGNKFSRTLGNIRQRLGGLRGLLVGAGAVFGARAVIQNTVQHERAIAQMDRALAAAGDTAGFTRAELLAMGDELQRVTTSGQTEVLELQSQLLGFRNITDDVFGRTIELMLDFSEVTGRDAAGALRIFGTALNDPGERLSRMAQLGITFSDSQEELIKSLHESGRTAEAQEIILGELESRYGGAARAARDTFGGALAGLSEAFGDLMRAEGGLPEARDNIESLTALLQDPATKDAFDSLMSAMISGFSRISTIVVNVVSGVEELAEALARLKNGPIDAADELDRVQEKIAATEKLLSGGSLPMFANRESLERQLARLREQERDLQRELRDLTGRSPFQTTDQMLEIPAHLRAREGGTASDPAPTPRDPVGGPDQPLVDVDAHDALMQQMESRSAEGFDRMSVFAEEAARGMQRSLADFFFDPFEQGLDGLLDSFLDVIRRMAAELAAQQVLTQAFGSFAGQGGMMGGFGDAVTAGVNHTGRGPGEASGSTRQVSPALLAMAPRFHTGRLGADEMPAILQRNESVLTPGQLRAVAGSGGGNVQVIDQRGADAPPIQRRRARGPDGREQMQLVVRESFREDLHRGVFDSDFQQVQGARRRGVMR